LRWKSVPPENIRVDSFFLADGAKAFNGKLYIHGGGWNFLDLEGPDATRMLSVAGRVIVPWEKTDRDLVFHISLGLIEDDATIELAPIVKLVLNSKPPPYPRKSMETATPFAFEVGSVSFSHPGEYAFVIRHEGFELARALFQVNFTGAGANANAEQGLREGEP
jgi:hypothetical protein